MQLHIDDQPQTFIPLQTFRTRWGLDDSFSLALFEPKEWTGLGTIEGAGPFLAQIKNRVIAAVPPAIAPPALPDLPPQLAQTFEQELLAANAQIGLRPVEVDFAVAGFHDMLQAVVFRLIQLIYTPGQAPTAAIQTSFDFPAIYQTWLDETARVAAVPHLYEENGHRFEVRVVYNAYGRVGLQVNTGDETYYVADMSLACPAASYMYGLCQATTEALLLALTL